MIRNFKSALPNLEAAEAAQIASIAEASTVIEEVAIPAAAPAPKKRGRKPKAAAEAAPAKAPRKTTTRKSKKDRASGYRLSEYDLLVFKALEETGSAMLTAEITDFIVAAQGKGADAAKAQVMVVRSLQKLANRRNDIRKVSYDGRGRAYALPKWVNGKGDLKRKHARK